MCMYVYCSYNEFINKYFSYEMYIYINIFMWIWNFYLHSNFFVWLEIIIWVVIPILKHLFESKNQYLNSKHDSNLKTDISILKILISILGIIFEPENCYSNFVTFYLNLKINISIWSFKSEFLKLLILFKNICLSIKL